MKRIRFGRMQLKIMQLLWAGGARTARDLTESLNKREAVAHSTVQTLLRKLEAKEAVGHREEGRTFWFFPLVDEEKATTGVIRDFLARLFHGSPGELAAHLVENEKISRADLQRLRELIEQREKKL
ncbi:MAG: BlaI/MecI/CopY family transcriptional regulator [Verrucomicrobiales bacterium]|nr:BlaI/MecI/CopY family transcriptional regulator [Verrucomicrobiales bacterium]